MNRKKLLPKHHTGKIRHHRHTSYSALGLALMLACVPLVLASRSVTVAAADPVTADNQVYAVVAGPAPATAPVINSPSQGATFTDANPVTISGTCPADTLIKVYKNDVLAGAALCQNGRFSVPIDLFIGPNTLVVRAFNASNAMGPESTPVVVQKQIPGISVLDAGQQFLVTSDIYYKGISTGSELSWPLTVSGGQLPYALNISWGDGKTDLISRAAPGSFDIKHTYEKSGRGYKGSYDVTIIATDANGNKSFIHLVTIVSDSNATGLIGSVKQGYDWSQGIRIAWQIMLVAVLLVLAFWLGERRELQLLKKK